MCYKRKNMNNFRKPCYMILKVHASPHKLKDKTQGINFFNTNNNLKNHQFLHKKR